MCQKHSDKVLPYFFFFNYLWILRRPSPKLEVASDFTVKVSRKGKEIIYTSGWPPITLESQWLHLYFSIHF